MRNFSKIVILPFAFCIITFSFSFSQNLVPNPSFEQFDTCPTSANQLQYCNYWSVYSDISSTPDYFNACAPSSGFGIPSNVLSYQPDHRNCGAYVGIVTWSPASNDREYVGVQLNQSLTIGQKYFISFYTVMGSEKLISGNYNGLPSNNLGIRLSTKAYTKLNPCPINNWSHLNHTAILNDSINWTRVSGNITADSAYNYLIVGNFYNDANTDTMNYNCSNCLNSYSYYLIDDICISPDSLLCNGGSDTLPCITGIHETFEEGATIVYPNPFTDAISISFINSQTAKVILLNIMGNIVYCGSLNNQKTLEIDLSSIPYGCYLLKVINNENNTLTKKIMKF